VKANRSREWREAEWDYDQIQVNRLIPGSWGALTQEEFIRELKGIVRRCPQFYPAVLEFALYQASTKGGKASERMIEKGFRLLVELAAPKDLDEQVDAVVENLEGLWRYDISRSLLEFLADRRPLSAVCHDSLAHAAARLGDLKSAQHHIGEALRIEPVNKCFWCNKGLYHLMAGELEQAADALQRARRLKPDDPVIKGNLGIHAYLSKKGGTYFDYLLRPLDRKQIDRWADQEKWDQVDSLCANYNGCRVEAFAQSVLLGAAKQRSGLPRLLRVLRSFFDFVEGIDSSGLFLNEDMGRVHKYFKPIMHKFIFKYGDVDHETIEDVYNCLIAYYGFLADRGVVAPAEFQEFRKSILGMKGEIIGKMERYNAIRHDPKVDDERKEALREDLFEGDHAWPHL